MQAYVKKVSVFTKFTLRLDVESEIEAAVLFSLFDNIDIVGFILKECISIDCQEVRKAIKKGSNLTLPNNNDSVSSSLHKTISLAV